jgi:hypothetical protein
MDGKPLEGATVSFLQVVASGSSDEESFLRPSAGLTDADGKFTLGTYSLDDGIPKGEYRVAIVKNEPAKAIPPGMSTESLPPEYSKMRWLTPKKYSQVETSELSAKVTSSGLSPNAFELKSLAKQEIE